MLLSKLIKDLPIKNKEIKIKGLSSNSKTVKKGYMFFAVKGNNFNGEKFIDEAIRRGAVAIVCSKKCKYKHKKIQIIKTSDIRYLLSEISSKFYKLKPKNIIAVTGTNGKTSVADLFLQILKLNKIPVSSIGTLGIKLKKKIIKTELTSPDAIFLHKSLEKIKKNKIDNVIIETSSHGLHQKRVDHINFKVGIFTNFSQDHLDYHKKMKMYLNAKLHLFENILPPKKAIISDRFIPEFSKLKKISRKRNLRLIDCNSIKEKLSNKRNVRMNDFQIKNLSMAIEAAKLFGLNETKIFKSLDKIKDVNGRLELVRTFHNKVKIYVDFAHTPDALLKSLQALRKSYGKNISVVFGCGGNRDFKKRSIMAKIASSNCKKIYVTDDNPRDEKPEHIRREIIKNIKNKNCYNIGNRTNAIKKAILNADPYEIILVAGKGHETNQIYKKKIIYISDKKIINGIKFKQISNKNYNFIENKNIFKKIYKKAKVGNFQGISIDSREVKKGNLFLTIKGKKNHGEKFISKALKRGARHIITSKKIKKFKNKIIKVKNVIEFLNNFAYIKRRYSNAQIFAVTGSAGKTSLKNLLKHLLEHFGNTLSSPKSYNNHLGVPISLSQLNASHKYGVFEVGMSKAGEINKLSRLIKPQIGIITNVGEAHIENFKNLKGIANAKGELINNISSNGTIILNRDDKYFNYFKKKAYNKSLKIVSFGMSKNSDVCPISIKTNKNYKYLIVRVKKQILNIEFKDLNIYNILSSLALLNELDLDLNKVTKSFKNFEPSQGRGKVHNIIRYKKKFKLIDESYNANPISVKNAIKMFNSIKKQNFKKYLLLGDMLELGNKSEVLHKDLSKVINSSDIDKVFIKGYKTINTYKYIVKDKRGNIFQEDEDVDFTLNNIIANNDYLMIKGSNATGLNKISKKIIKGY